MTDKKKPKTKAGKVRETWDKRYRGTYADKLGTYAEDLDGAVERIAHRHRPMKPSCPIQNHASDTGLSLEDAFIRAAAWDQAAAIDRDLLQQLQTLETKGIQIPKKLISNYAGVDLTVDSTDIDTEEMNEVLRSLDQADRGDREECLISTATLRKLIVTCRRWESRWEGPAEGADLKPLLEAWVKATESDPEGGKIQVRNLTDQQLRLPGGKALDPYVKEDALIVHTHHKAIEKGVEAARAIVESETATDEDALQRLEDLFYAMQVTHDAMRKAPEGGEMEQEGDVFTREMLQEAKKKFMAAHGEKWDLAKDAEYLTEAKMRALGVPECFIPIQFDNPNLPKWTDGLDTWVSNEQFGLTLNTIAKNPDALASLLDAAEDDRLPEDMPLRLRKLVAKFVDEQLSDGHREGVMVKPRGFERGDHVLFESTLDTARFSSKHPNQANTPKPGPSEYVTEGATVYACDSSRRVTTKAPVGYTAPTPLGRIVKPGETVHQGMVNEYPLAETGEMVDVLLDMGPDSYTAEEGEPTLPEWCKPAMQWFKVDPSGGSLTPKDRMAFVVGLFGKQVQNGPLEFLLKNDGTPGFANVKLTSQEAIAEAEHAQLREDRLDFTVHTAINYGERWGARGTVVVSDIFGANRPELKDATEAYARLLFEDFTAGPMWLWETPTGRKPSKPAMQNIPAPAPVQEWLDELKKPLEKVSATLDEMHTYATPPWLRGVESRFRRRFKEDGSLEELEIHPHYRSEFFIAVDGHSDMGKPGIRVSFDRSGTSCHSQIGIRPIIRMPTHYATDHEFAKRLIGQTVDLMDKEGSFGFAAPLVFALVNRELDWELKCEGTWVTQTKTSGDGKETTFYLSTTVCHAISVEEMFGGANVKRGLSPVPAPAPQPRDEPIPVVVDNSVDHDLAALQRKQIDAAKAQLLGTTTSSLTYIVPKGDHDE